MHIKHTLSILLITSALTAFSHPNNNGLLQKQWTKALEHQSISSTTSNHQKIGVLFTIDEANKVKILNLAGADKDTYQKVMHQLNGLDNISDLTPNEIYRINITFQAV